jgi:hypothetical protein
MRYIKKTPLSRRKHLGPTLRVGLAQRNFRPEAKVVTCTSASRNYLLQKRTRPYFDSHWKIVVFKQVAEAIAQRRHACDHEHIDRRDALVPD